jgi:hypothetical protein
MAEKLVDGLTKAEWIAREHAYRDSLDEGDFWNYVLLGIKPGEEPEPPYYDPEDLLAIGAVGSPCPECGQETECGYDAEGRAYVHVTEENDDA